MIEIAFTRYFCFITVPPSTLPPTTTEADTTTITTPDLTTTVTLEVTSTTSTTESVSTVQTTDADISTQTTSITSEQPDSTEGSGHTTQVMQTTTSVQTTDSSTQAAESTASSTSSTTNKDIQTTPETTVITDMSYTTEDTHLSTWSKLFTQSLITSYEQADCQCTCNEYLDSEELEKRLQYIRVKLTVNKTLLSSNIRKKLSAYDERQSSTIIGYTGGMVIAFVVLFLTASDIVLVLKTVVNCCRK